ncbi:MAG: hypothetical protein LBB48_09270 [Treponema sp.]|jgi:hypothetical protein|nr:hypothetical protein [Treponema sp.]
MKKFWLICLAGLLAIGMSFIGCAGTPAPATDAPAVEESVDDAGATDESVEEAPETEEVAE